jgi:hypothetical protein
VEPIKAAFADIQLDGGSIILRVVLPDKQILAIGVVIYTCVCTILVLSLILVGDRTLPIQCRRSSWACVDRWVRSSVCQLRRWST